MSHATDLATVRTYCTRTAAQTIRMADALVRLNTASTVGGRPVKALSVRAIADAIADTAAPLGKTRIALVIKTRRANPDADAAAFAALLSDATAANTGSRVADAAPVVDQGEPTTVPAVIRDALSTGPGDAVAPVTLDALTDRLADLFEAARSLSADDLRTFLAAVDAEAAYSAPVAVSLPVAV